MHSDGKVNNIICLKICDITEWIKDANHGQGPFSVVNWHNPTMHAQYTCMLCVVVDEQTSLGWCGILQLLKPAIVIIAYYSSLYSIPLQI